MKKMRRHDREITDLHEIESILEKAEVCSVGLVDRDKPYVVALNFGYENNGQPRLWFHGAGKGRKLDIIDRNPSAFFQVDTDHKLVTAEEACDFTMLYRSVTGSGKITIVQDREEKIHGLNVIMKHYTGHSDFIFEEPMLNKTTVFRLDIDEMTGKRKK
ncbi:MAG: pyridoxamine 5'-phosphate oxidase family protein [Chlorobi bacterium]|nr:pyridoxamine 5'-phosphate oxidase family protein [Chlorobiota bacterium]